MEPMKSVSGLCALLFGLIGGAFVLMGAVFGLLKVPVRGAVHSGWAFVPLGLAGLLLALACAGLACRRHRREASLRAAGVPVAGAVVQVRKYWWINWNTDSFVNWPGKCSPWVVRCSYEYQGQTYQVNSCLLWREPAPGEQRPVVYVDPNCPRLAFVDADTIRCRA